MNIFKRIWLALAGKPAEINNTKWYTAASEKIPPYVFKHDFEHDGKVLSAGNATASITEINNQFAWGFEFADLTMKNGLLLEERFSNKNIVDLSLMMLSELWLAGKVVYNAGSKKWIVVENVTEERAKLFDAYPVADNNKGLLLILLCTALDQGFTSAYIRQHAFGGSDIDTKRFIANMKAFGAIKYDRHGRQWHQIA